LIVEIKPVESLAAVHKTVDRMQFGGVISGRGAELAAEEHAKNMS
jgi:hypothetical protein